MHFFTKSIKILLLPGLMVSVAATQLYAQQTDSVTKAPAVISKVPKIIITGIVKEEATGKALSGINISVIGYSAALTDDKGQFKISVRDLNSLLTISGPGYQTKVIALKGKNKVNVTLFEEGYSSQYNMAMLPYSTVSKNQVPFAVSSINTQGSWNRALETPDSYLQGRVAGMDVVRRSGTPDIGADILLRGYNSLFATNQPLIVVDGMIYDNNNYAKSIIAGHVTNHFADIDVKDIDNITVIKDGNSTYGTRGSNGVILITTGRAKDVATRLDFAAYGGINGTVKTLPVMQADNYRIYLADVLKTQPGVTDAMIQAQPYFNDNPNPNYYTYHQNTDWQKQVMGSSSSQNYYLKVTGGDNIATYALSVGYLGNRGLTNNTDLTRYESRFNANLNLSKNLTSRVNLTFSKAEQNLRDQGQAYNTNPLYLSLIKAPFLYPNQVSANGTVSPNIAKVDTFGISNPVAAANKIQELNRNYRFMGSIAFDYIINRQFTVKTIFGLTYDKVRENSFYPSNGIAPTTFNTFIANDQAIANVQRLFSVFTDARLQYSHDFDKSNKLFANLGFRYNNSSTESDYGYGFNTASDDFVSLSGASNVNRIVGGALGKWNWLNTYLNADYNAFNKYFVSFNLAVDGSSRFGQQADGLSINGVKYAVLPSVAASWLLSSEKFMANNKFIEMLKLRASYGLVGNDDIGNYSGKSLYTTQSFLSRQGLVPLGIGNPGIQWESVAKLNLGVDAGFLNERLNVSIDVYNHKISNMLVYQPVNTGTGFDYALTNSGGMSNRGIELDITGRIINKSTFKWDMGLNVSANRNKVTSLPNGGSSLLTSYGGATIITQIGQPANLFYGYKTNGVYTTNAEAAASGLTNKLTTGYTASFQGGDMRFVDVNGDKIIDEKDKQVIGNPNPDWIGGYSNRLTYKRWTLDAMFVFSVGNDIYNSTRASIESLAGVQNQSTAAVNRWRFDGQVTNIPRASYGDPGGNARFSDRWIENGSYLRFRTLSLSYNIPVKSGFFRSATVYAMGNNLLTFTKYLGYDPEFSASNSIFARGVDVGLEPMVTSMQLGLRVGL